MTGRCEGDSGGVAIGARVSFTGEMAFVTLMLMLSAATVAGTAQAAHGDAAAMRQALGPATRAVLERALGQPGPDQLRALEELPRQSDWQAVVDLLVEEIRTSPGESHNDRALAIEFIARQRLDDIRIDVGPLIDILGTPSWTNQQKGAQALAALSRRREIFTGRDRDAVRALVRLTTSQRGRVVDAALDALTHLTGQSFGRDPEAWAAWVERAWGERVHLDDAVYEVLAVIRRRPAAGGALEFSLNEGAWTTDSLALEPAFRQLAESAAARGVPVSTVLIVPEIGFDEKTILAQVEPLRPLFRKVQPEELTFSPETDVFYAPWTPARCARLRWAGGTRWVISVARRSTPSARSRSRMPP